MIAESAAESFDPAVSSHSELVYNLRPEYRRFVARVGVQEHGERSKRGSITARIELDGELVAQSPVLRHNGAPFDINVAIPAGTKRIALVITDGGDGRGWNQPSGADVCLRRGGVCVNAA